jgi:hypothetical protein
MTSGAIERMYADPNSPDYDFHARIGRTLTQWQQIESALCLFFARHGKMPRDIARRVFYSVEGFRPRYRMLLATFEGDKSNSAGFLRTLQGRCRNATHRCLQLGRSSPSPNSRRMS